MSRPRSGRRGPSPGDDRGPAVAGDDDLRSWFLLVFVGGLLVALVLNAAVAATVRSLYPPAAWPRLRVCVLPLFAGASEPLATKLVPALALVGVAETRGLAAQLREEALLLGVGAGLLVGLLEAAQKTLLGGRVSLAVFPPVLVHVATGVLVATAVFRHAGARGTRRARLEIAAGFAGGVVLHVLWNTRLAFWLAGGNPC